MKREDAMKWHKNLVRQGKYKLARRLLRAILHKGKLTIPDGDDEAYESGLANYLLKNCKYTNYRNSFSIKIH